MKPMTPEVQLALGRLFRMMSRPSQPGDVEMFYKIHDIVLNAGDTQLPDYRPNYAAQRLTGAQGDS